MLHYSGLQLSGEKCNHKKTQSAQKPFVTFEHFVVSSAPFKVNPLDPIPGLFEEAIRRAEVKGFV